MDRHIGTEHNPLRLLILDDGMIPVKHILAMLRNADYVVKPARAKNANEALVALKKYVWDLVLAAASHPIPESIRAFTSLAQRKAYTPLLTLVEDVNSAIAIQALGMGARDAISIHHPERFLHVIQRELHDLANRRTQYILEMQHEKLRSSQGKPAVSTGNSANIDILIQSIARQYENSNSKHDPLTNLYARHYFIGELKQILNSIESDDIHYGLLHIEPDNFGNIREELGLSASNSVLTDIARLLRNCLGQLAPIARMDNHTFCALVSYNDRQELITMAERIRTLVAKHVFAGLDMATPFLTASIGVCMVNGHNADPHRLLFKAGRACEIAQAGHGDAFHIYNPETDEISDKTSGRDWDDMIRSALKRDNFRLAFQPIIELHSMARENYEILLRMADKDGSEILPGKFMLAAEHTGLITSIDQWVVKQAIRELAEHTKKGKQANFFIKLSNETVNSDTFLPWLIKELKNTNLAKNSLVFEINATELSKHPIEIHNFIKLLRKVNCRSTLEYFGTQKNLTNIIRELPVDFLKIDRSLIHNLAENPEHQDIITSITGMAHKLDKRVIAEFVEDARTLSLLWNAGVDFIQGHFLQQPGDEMNYDFSEQAI